MTRLYLALGLLIVLIVAVLATVNIRSDAAAIFGPEGIEMTSLDTPAGREVVVALEATDADTRLAAAARIAELLQADPLVASVSSGPVAPSPAFLDWLWTMRLQLAPPGAGDFTPDAMAERLGEARDTLTSAEGMLTGDRLLRDPTGSYGRLIQRLNSGSERIGQRDGVWESTDGRAALLFATLAERPFETGEVRELVARLRAAANDAGTIPTLLGPRIIAAEISAATARGSTSVAVLASVLLIAWLVWNLRSVSRIGIAVLPLALGFASAVLVVQALFGQVHVIALGFGGALTGLALDYPLHLIGHAGPARRRAARLVGIGSVTTAIAFLAMLGSGVPALMQTGIFIATGLLVAAGAAVVLEARESNNTLRTPSIDRLRWTLPFKRWIEAALVLGGVLIVANAGSHANAPMFEPPAQVTASIETLRTLIDLPSGRYAVIVEGKTLADLLQNEAEITPALEAAIAAGDLGSYDMLSGTVGAPGTALPSVVTFRSAAESALAQSGMTPAFIETQVAAYRAARDAPPLSVGDLNRFSELKTLAMSLERTETGVREVVRLGNPVDPEALGAAIPPDKGVLIDRAAPVEAGLADLRRQVTLWLALGALAGFACLFAGLGDARRAVGIVLTTGGAMGFTAGVATLIGGPLGIFEIIALTLVAGIGIDYGLFLEARKDAADRVRAAQSVALCAGSTLLAFGVMALSPIELLHEIGFVVLLGVLVVLGLNIAQEHGKEH